MLIVFWLREQIQGKYTIDMKYEIEEIDNSRRLIDKWSILSNELQKGMNIKYK